MCGQTALRAASIVSLVAIGLISLACAGNPATSDGAPSPDASGSDASPGGDVTPIHFDGATDVTARLDAVPARDGGPIQMPPLNLCGDEPVNGTLPAAGSRVGALPDGAGGTTCITFGVDPTISSTVAYAPDPGGLTIYVATTGTGGSGTMASPFGSIAEALRSAAGAENLLLARGSHRVDGTIVVDRNVRLIGVGTADGSGGTTLQPGSGTMLLFSARTSSGQLAMQRLRVALGTTAGVRGVEVQRDARVVLSDVVMTGGSTAVDVAPGGFVDTDRVNVTDTLGDALSVGGTALVRSSFVSVGAGHGISVRGRLVASELLVTRQAQGGIRFDGASTEGADRLDRVALVGNVGYGLRVGGMGRETHVRMSSLSGNREAATARAGYGAIVTAGAAIAFDLDRAAPENRRLGTLVAGNAIAGIVATATAGSIATHGGNVLRNAGPGMIIEGGVGSAVVNETYFGFNHAIGLGLLGGFLRGSTIQILCDMFEGTQVGLAAFGRDSISGGDGLFMMSPAGMEWSTSMPIRGSTFAGNSRFGACLWNVGTHVDNGTFRCNGFDIARYGSATTLATAADQFVTDRAAAGVQPDRATLGMVRGDERMADPGF